MNKVTKSIDEVFENDIQDQEFQKYDRSFKPYRDIVADIINRRIALNLTQNDLAKRVNTFQSRISKIESGEHDLRLSTIIQIAEALETELSISLVPMEKRISVEYWDEIIQRLFYKEQRYVLPEKMTEAEVQTLDTVNKNEILASV